MKPMAYNYHYEFHVCTQTPDGNEVIGFDIYLGWRRAKTEIEPAGSWSSELLVRIESHFIGSDDEFIPIFNCRVKWNSDQASKLLLRAGRRRFTSRIRACGSGGNWHWEIYLVPKRREAHLLNWLRNFRADQTEWDSQFVERIWAKRGAIRSEHLRVYARDHIRYLKMEGA